MGYVELQEPVAAWVEFSPQGEIRPRAFAREGRRLRIKQVTYRWRTGKGRETWRHFSVVTENGDAFQLSYREESATWWIERVWTEG